MLGHTLGSPLHLTEPPLLPASHPTFLLQIASLPLAQYTESSSLPSIFSPRPSMSAHIWDVRQTTGSEEVSVMPDCQAPW